MRKFLLLLLIGVIAFPSWAQDRNINGKVTSNDGEPLPGVNVLLKGTTNGTVTDSDGLYKITLPSSAGILVFSFIGFASQEVSIGEKTVIDVTLLSDVRQLSEVVVTGVGVATERRKVAIDVTSISAKNMVPTAVASVDQAIQGKIAGAQVQLASGEPGAAANIILRGLNSLGSSQPIILLDGVQITSMNGLDLSNIESVEVVKGAAAGMLYGAQGANGVIQIFSKKGSKSEKVLVTLNSRYFIDQAITGKTDLKSSLHHYDTDAQGFILSTVGGRIAPDPVEGTWTEPSVNLTAGLKNDKPYQEKTFNQLDQVYIQAASQNHSLNISGGSGKTDYSLNFNYLRQENVRFGDLERKNISLNIGSEVVKGLTVRSITQLQLENENLQSGNRFALVNSYPWVDFNARYSNGFLIIKPKAENEFNPLSELEWRTRESEINRIIQNVNINYKFPKFVTIDYKYGVQFWNTQFDDITRSQQGFLFPSAAFWGPAPGTGTVYQEYEKSVYQNSLLSAYLAFDLANDFDLNVPITSTTQFTYDWRSDKFNEFFGRASGFAFPPYNLNNGQNKVTGSFEREFVTYGYLINQAFDYKDIAGVSVGFRSDFSSAFGFNADGSKPKAFTFPRGTVYFNPSSLFDSDLVAAWKLRAAYGEAGIQPGAYQRQLTLTSQPYGSSVGLYNPSIAPNPALTVQISKELEVGTDVTLTPSVSDKWLRKIDLGFTFWDRASEDIIQPANVAPSTGASGYISNLVTLNSTGIELSLDMQVLNSSKFSWNFGFRYGTAETMVNKISQGLDVPYGENGTFLIREGEPLGIFIGQVPITRLDELKPDGSPYIDPADRGDYEVVSTQYGDLVVNKTTKVALISGSDDKRVMGNPQPKFFGSFINDFTLFKHLQINMQWDFVYGNQIYNQTRQWLYRDRLSKDFDLPVSIDGESGAWVTMHNSLYNSVQPSGWFIEDGSFMRLRNLSLTYDLKGVVKANWAKQLSLSIGGRNLVTFTKYRGLDPESRSTDSTTDSDGNSTGPGTGIDSFNFPNLRQYQVGLTFSF
jgi:TonB-dependent starch-binding outer membrane protein SusC